jgi:DNA polymerase-3 subunit alpha
VITWPDTYRKHEAIVRSGEPVVILGALEISAERCQIIAEELTPLAEARADSISQVHVRVVLPEVGRDLLSTLREVLAGHPGPCDAFLHLVREDHSETVLALPETLRVAASDQIVNAIEAILGTGVLSFR